MSIKRLHRLHRLLYRVCLAKATATCYLAQGRVIDAIQPYIELARLESDVLILCDREVRS